MAWKFSCGKGGIAGVVKDKYGEPKVRTRGGLLFTMSGNGVGGFNTEARRHGE